jgi:methyl-accepting chemotaxis protein/methyl-accepting chemotaxis protein-1 (serine sensor receptor)
VLTNHKISHRLFALVGALSLLILLVGSIDLFGLQQSNRGLKSVYYDKVVPLKQLKVVSDMYAVNIVDTAHKVRDGGKTAAQGLESIAEARKSINENWKLFLAAGVAAQEAPLVTQFESLRTKADSAIEALEKLLKASDMQGLTAYAAKDLYVAMDPLQEALAKLIQVQLDLAQAEYKGAEDRYETTSTVTITAVVLGLLLAVLVGGSTSRQISRSLAQAVGATDAIARGDLSVSIHPEGKDEIAHLMGGLQVMRNGLSHVVAGVRGHSEGVASASSQIASGNNDLSMRTEQQVQPPLVGADVGDVRGPGLVWSLGCELSVQVIRGHHGRLATTTT